MQKKTFPLIEIIVVISVIALVMPAIFAIVFGILRQQTKIYRLSTVKKEGDFILNIIGATIRNNALTIYSSSPPDDTNGVCQIVESYPSSSSLFFEDQWGSWFGFSESTNRISSSASVLASPLILNSEKTLVSNFAISCDRLVTYSPAVVSLSFDICYSTASGSCISSRPEETASLHYATKIKLRNY